MFSLMWKKKTFNPDLQSKTKSRTFIQHPSGHLNYCQKKTPVVTKFQECVSTSASPCIQCIQ